MSERLHFTLAAQSVKRMRIQLNCSLDFGRTFLEAILFC